MNDYKKYAENMLVNICIENKDIDAFLFENTTKHGAEGGMRSEITTKDVVQRSLEWNCGASA